MFNKLKEKCMLLAISATPLSAFAHTGHDHQSNWSFLIHLLWLAPLVFATYIAINAFKNKKNTNK
ncbi:MAG: hypothetical protein V5786_10535 [Psychromonas sp.]